MIEKLFLFLNIRIITKNLKPAVTYNCYLSKSSSIECAELTYMINYF